MENEYGSYGKDKKYMAANRDNLRDAGFDIPLCTADGPKNMMMNGSVDGALVEARFVQPLIAKLEIERHRDVRQQHRRRRHHDQLYAKCSRPELHCDSGSMAKMYPPPHTVLM